MNHPRLQRTIFLLLLAAITLAFLWLLLPYSGAIFWAFVFAILFMPLFRRILARFPERRGLSAMLTLFCCLLIAILPLAVITFSLVQEGDALYQRLLAGDVDFNRILMDIYAGLPGWIRDILGVSDISDISDMQAKLNSGLIKASRDIAGRALSIGQNIFAFAIAFAVMLYLLFFLLRDGETLAASIRKAIPLSDDQKDPLLEKFLGVIRATVKGNLIVALIQGALGGLVFWILGLQAPLLWGAIMAFLSLFPVGAAIIWLPAALYLLGTGAMLKGLILVLFGALAIGMVDNLLRPVLVGKDTQMPDYVVLISTLGGLSLFGLNGFVIGPVIAAMFLTAWQMFSGSGEDLPETPVDPE